MEALNSFDKLVSGLSSAERKDMLSKMNTNQAPDSVVMEGVEVYDKNERVDFSQKLKQESFLTRFIVWLKSIISGGDTVAIYNLQVLQTMKHKVHKDFPSLIDSTQELLLQEFYHRLGQLKLCAKFFNRYIAACAEDENDYYVFLGSMLMGDIEEAMESEVNPFSMPLSREITMDLRSSLLRTQEEIFSRISSAKKDKMYEAIRGYEWLKQFCRLPFDSFITRFSSTQEKTCVCPFSSVAAYGDLANFARVLCNSRLLPDDMLKSLFLFSVKNRATKDLDDLDSQESPESFMQKAMSQVALIKMFLTSVPLRTICCIVNNDAAWIPQNLGGGEDWFVKFKAQWKKIFDQQWKAWSTEAKKEKLKGRLEDYFGIQNYPLLPNRPWKSLWGGVFFRYELTMGFLYYLVCTKYTAEYAPILKTVVLAGEFSKKDTQSEFTDIFNEFSELAQDISGFVAKLDDSGDVGLEFLKVASNKLRTPQGEAKIAQVIEQLELDSQTFLQKFGKLSRTQVQMLKALQGEKSTANYGVLTNLQEIQGRQNDAFRKSLVKVVLGLQHAIEMVTELEPLDAPL